MADLTYAQASALLKYDPETGKLFWKERPADMFRQCGPHSPETRADLWNSQYAGTEALGSINGSGYKHGSILYRSYKAHRVAWLLHFGQWPDHTIDHINGDPADNRIANLRDVPQRINSRNLKRHFDNRSGVTGVCLQQKTQKWMAFINGNHGLEMLGLFDDKKSAVAARKDAERRYGYHQNHGR